MIIRKPPMGWNTWNTFGPDISERLIMESAEAMVNTGLKEAGYEYIVIDDMWSLKERDADDRLQADPEKFPHGIKYLSDYVHSLGLKLGIYSCGGYLTCGGYPGSYGHEWEDAKTFAEWGVDLLKYDYCFHPAGVDGADIFRRMGIALADCGRDILYMACSWGVDDTRQWIRSTGAHTWRSTGDINDSWVAVRDIALSQMQAQEYNAPGCYNDMDMLVVGMNNQGMVALGGCTEAEYKLHFSLWAFLQSPLMIGCDIRNMDESTRRILLNRDIIALNQDESCHQAYIANNPLQVFGTNEKKVTATPNRAPGEPFYQYSDYCLSRSIMVRYLADGDIALIRLNFRDHDISAAPLIVTPDMLGLPEEYAKRMQVTDLWTGEKLALVNGTIPQPGMGRHDCQVYRIHIE